MVLGLGQKFPGVTLHDMDGNLVEFPSVFSFAPATVLFFYRGGW